MPIRKYVFAAIILSLLLAGCGKKGSPTAETHENTQAKAMLAGVWIDVNEGDVVFMVKGDSIFYPDSASRAVRFAIYSDTLVMYGNTVSKYRIVRQTKRLFELKTQAGDLLSMSKSDDPYDVAQFEHRSSVALNQRTLIKRDTIVAQGDKRYHCYVQVNPTTYKVFRTSHNSEGLEVDYVYYDNIIHVSLFQGASKIFSKDFAKTDFASVVPANILPQCVLSDILLTEVDEKGLHCTAQLAIPDSPSSYVPNIFISFGGKFDISVK